MGTIRGPVPGLRTAPFIFTLFSEGLHWILEWVFSRDLIHYLDDFLLVNDPDPEFFGALASYCRFTSRSRALERRGFATSSLRLMSRN